MNLLALMFSTTFFTGFLPGKITGKPGKGGGLAGSIVALLIQLYFVHAGFGFNANLILIVSSFFIGLLSVPGGAKYIYLKWGMLKRHDGTETNFDYNEINIDEVHGQAISGASAFLFNITPICRIIFLLFSFVLFRFFDTNKTWPIKNVEKKTKGAFGIMFDDTVGGIMAMITTMIAILFVYIIVLTF